MALVLGGGRVVLAERVLEQGWVVVEGGRIRELGDGTAPYATDVDCTGLWLAPGFVDTHVHGGGGASFATTSVEEVARAAEFHRRQGSTTIVASLVSTSIEVLEQQIAVLSECVKDGSVAGVHLEGPWLSPARRGAHDARYLRAPTPADVDRLLRAGSGTIRMVTLAPELPGAIDAIRAVAEHGAVVAIGHTDATYAQTQAAIHAGGRVATHLFNAMRPLHHREPGPVLALLEDPRVTLEIITDGVHVHDDLLRWVMATAGFERVSQVTDAISAAGVGDGRFELGGQEVVVQNGQARLAADPSALAGSTLTMADAVCHAVQVLGLSVPTATRMASQVPAAALGLTEAGAIRVGAPADLVLLDETGQLQAVMRGGEWVSHQ
jgi:N-acetylglucosamine-6-phosphate deacetylase